MEPWCFFRFGELTAIHVYIVNSDIRVYDPAISPPLAMIHLDAMNAIIMS